jgi:oligosaccharide repeat unit polymerase
LIVLLGLSSGNYTELLLYFMLYVDILIVAAWLHTSSWRSVDIMDPFFVVIGIYTLYAWSAGWAAVIVHPEYGPVMSIYYLAVVLGLVGFVLGYRWVANSTGGLAKKLSEFRLQVSASRFLKLSWFLAVVLAALTAGHLFKLFDIYDILPYADWAASSRVERTATSGPIDYLNEMAISLMICALLVSSFMKRRTSILAFALVGVYAIPTIMAGQKAPVVTIALLVAVYRNYVLKPLRPVHIAALGLAIYVFATLFNHVRNTTYLGEMYSEAVYLVKTEPAILMPAYSGEFSNPARTLMNIIGGIQSGKLSYSYGYTYITELLTFVPRVFYRNRPLPMSELHMQLFYPLEAAQGRGIATFMPTEGYWAFGLPGVVLAMLVYGALVSALYKVFLVNRRCGPLVLVYGLLYMPFIVLSTRTGLLGSVKATLMTLAPFLIILLLSSRLVRQAARTSSSRGAVEVSGIGLAHSLHRRPAEGMR